MGTFPLRCSLTAWIGISLRWKIPAANADSALVFSNTSEKCATLPAPLEAITGMETALLTVLINSRSNPELVPSLSIQIMMHQEMSF